MADFEFRGTAEERRKQAEVILVRIHRDLYGNGTPGMLGKMDHFITQHDTTEEIRKVQHKENQDRLQASQAKMNLIIGLLMLLIALLSAAPAVRALFKSSTEYLPDVFHTQTFQSAENENAYIPNVR